MAETGPGNIETKIPSQKSWYRLVLPGAHVGAGRCGEKTVYLFARDPIDAINRAKSIGGWKKGVGSKALFPEIRQLNTEEWLKLKN